MRILAGGAPKPPARTSKVRRDRLARARAAFDDAYRTLYSRACRAVRKYADDSTEDVVQQAFMELWASCYRNGEVPAEAPKALLYRILRLRLIDYIRVQRRDRERDANVDYADELAGRITNQVDTARVAEGHLLQARIDYLLAAMPPNRAEAFRLSIELPRDPEAIGKALGTDKETARWYVWDAKRRLKAALGNDNGAGDEDGQGGDTR